MTTNIKINTNGSYVSEGTLQITSPDGSHIQNQEVKVGPGSMVEKSFYIPHGSKVVLDIVERNATPDEIEAAKPKSE